MDPRECKSVTVMFCGPHYNDSGVPNDDRFLRAAKIASYYKTPLLICGDGNNGRDVQWFASRAFKGGLQAITKHDPRANTRADAASAVEMLQELPHVTQIYLVTTWFHGPRAMLALQQALRAQMPERQMQIKLRPSLNAAHLMTDLKLVVGEARGIIDYLRGRERTFGKPFGKPVHARSGAGELPRPRVSRVLSLALGMIF